MSEALTWYGWEVLPSGCWVWSGQRNDEGYGQFFYKGRMVRAHRDWPQNIVDQMANVTRWREQYRDYELMVEPAGVRGTDTTNERGE